MRMTIKRMVLSCISAMMAIPAAMAAEDPGASLRACRAEADDARRLACYDREIDRIGKEQATLAAESPPVLTPEEQFGRTGAMAREESDRKNKESRDLGELSATVTEIWSRSDGLMVFTLDNGQVWKQNAPDSHFRLKSGEKVKIQPASMSSFLLSGPSKRSTRVTRLK